MRVPGGYQQLSIVPETRKLMKWGVIDLHRTAGASIIVCTDAACAYNHCMKRHTTLNIDPDLVAEARRALGTRGTTDTVHAALEDVEDAAVRDLNVRGAEVRATIANSGGSRRCNFIGAAARSVPSQKG